MRKHHYKLMASGMTLLGLSMACMSPAMAAKPINLQDKPASFLQSFSTRATINGSLVQSDVKQLRADVDFNQTSHIRIQQNYAGYPVWGSDGVVHVPANTESKTLQAVMQNPHGNHVTMNGVMYQDLQADLQAAPAYIFNSSQADKVLQQAIQLYQKNAGINNKISESKANLMVYIDKNNKAHWAFLVSFMASTAQATPAKPTYIMDALTLNVYQQWNDIQTLTNGGGFGGNPKMGELSYDGLNGDYPALDIRRDATTKTCYLQNKDVTVRDEGRQLIDDTNYPVVQFACSTKNNDHNHIYWDADQDKTNEAYSPSNDALYVGKVVKEMYQNWYGLPVLTKNGKPMMLNMIVHVNMENAFWNGQAMYFGDGQNMFYPLVSLGVGAHEISHGFTQQHSNLIYSGQSGGLNEAFSDMAAQAAEFYSIGHNSWQIGPEIMKAKDKALRYMDEPSKDCEGRQPGDWCSISSLKEYQDSIDVHFTSGVFNKAFYLLGTAEGWDTKKAFDVMVQANAHYWTSTTSFADAACGVVKAAQDYKYDLKAVTTAMAGVGIDTSNC